MAVARPDVALEPAYFLATSIIASSDLHDVAPIARTKYADEIASLRPIAERKLALFAGPELRARSSPRAAPASTPR